MSCENESFGPENPVVGGEQVAAARVPQRAPAAGPWPPPFPYLESERCTSEASLLAHHTEKKEEGQEEKKQDEEAVEGVPTGRLMCKRLGCGCVWCSNGCGLSKGLALRDALKVELESFRSPYFVTLTLDRDLFPEGPEFAMGWVQSGGVISEFVRLLRRGGHLLDRRYFNCVEFQANGGWPHWHLVFDAEFVPFFDICEAWAAAGWSGKEGQARWGRRPVSEKGKRPVFGGVQFRLKGSGELGRLCHYLTHYLTKTPAGGWPDWVMRTDRQLRRWSTSQDFWRAAAPPRRPKPITEFSKLRGQYFDQDEEFEEDEPFLRRIRKSKQRIGHRIESCGLSSVVLEEVELPPGPGECGGVLRWRYVGMVRSDVWRDPSLPEDQRTFAQLDELGSRSFVVVPGCKTRLGMSAVDLLWRLVEDEQKKKRAEFLAKFRTEGSL